MRTPPDLTPAAYHQVHPYPVEVAAFAENVATEGLAVFFWRIELLERRIRTICRTRRVKRAAGLSMLPEKKAQATRAMLITSALDREGVVGRRGGRWPSRTRRVGSRWWLWYCPMYPPDPEKVLGGLRIGRILITGIGGNLG